MPSANTTNSITPTRDNAQATSVVARKHPVEDLAAYWKEYARERPEVCALWCFGIGFVLGWKLKPW